MTKTDIIQILTGYHEYLAARKEIVFHDIEQTKQKIETIQAQIKEKETYIELQSEKEKQESNIFTLYDTTNQYAENIRQLKELAKQLGHDKEQNTAKLKKAEQEMQDLTSQLISIQRLQRQLGEEQGGKEPEPAAGQQDADAVKNQSPQYYDKEMPRNTMQDIRERLQFCLDILDLDPKRCSLELNLLIKDLT